MSERTIYGLPVTVSKTPSGRFKAIASGVGWRCFGDTEDEAVAALEAAIRRDRDCDEIRQQHERDEAMKELARLREGIRGLAAECREHIAAVNKSDPTACGDSYNAGVLWSLGDVLVDLEDLLGETGDDQ